jgi:hypothetical protein
MIVDVPGEGQYSIRFAYFPSEDGRRAVGCTIDKVVMDGDEPTYHTRAEGISTCSRKDNYCRKVGRLIAFRRAVEEAFPGPNLERKRAREMFWGTFRAICKLPAKNRGVR